MTAPCRVILADDNRFLQECLRQALARRPEFVVTGEASDGLELLRFLGEGAEADVLILDLSMPGLRGIQALQQIREWNLDVRVLVLTLHDEEELLSQALRAGADGYLLKNEITNELFTALDTILRDEVYISPSMVRDVRDSWLNVFIASKGIPCGETLSPWQIRLLRLLAQGTPKEEIARSVGIRAQAVDHHRRRITGKLRIGEPAELVSYAIGRGYVGPDAAPLI